MSKVPLDFTAVRASLQQGEGRRFWRSLEELAESEACRAFIEREFPQHASEWLDPVGRRTFLRLMGGSLALAGLGACTRQPEERIVPYVDAPEILVPGQPLFFATALPLNGIGTGVLAESHMGRPTKIEGNDKHPASLGATDVFAQAAVLSLYDPDRSQTVNQAGRLRTWPAFLAAMNTALEAQRLKRGAGLRVLTETVTSPTLAEQLRAFLTMFPAASWHQYDPLGRNTVQAGARLAFGEALNTTYRVDKAEVILSLEADFLTAAPGALRYGRDFVARRQVRGEQTTMNRLYVVESTPTLTGTMADHRFPLKASAIAGLARTIMRLLEAPEATGAAPDTTPAGKWAATVARDLARHRGTSLVIAGDQQPPVVHALAHAMNHLLGNVGHTVVYTDPIEDRPLDHMVSLRALIDDMATGKVEVLVILGGNPVYTAPADLHFADQLAKVPLRLHLSLYNDETSALCHWHIHEAHALEIWSDVRAYDGTVTVMQPLIAPLYDGKSAHELLAALMGQPERNGYTIVREYWQQHYQGNDFETFWRTALHDGLVATTTLPTRQPIFRREALQAPAAEPVTPQGLELIFRPDPTVWDGRFANNGWLQELPKPLTKLTWDNAALLSPATAARLGVQNEEVVELRYLERSVRAPIWIMPGHVDEAVTVHLGYGRWRAGRVGSGIGFNAYSLRTSTAPWFDSGLEIRPTGERYALATTQQHHTLEGRHLVRVGTLEHFLTHPHFVHDLVHEPAANLTFYPPHPYEGYAWGMAIDLHACLGCNACVIACQAENNIPIVGKPEVIKGREMHWLRIDRYYAGPLGTPETYHQPVMCMHCENAPCEVVCPVAATAHSSEGLNDMVYNRCVGTRYCSNNCPYKVRRFNFLQWNDFRTESLKLQRNPDVTVRTRGVMEKCTYCVQRINAARIEAKKDDRTIRDGDIVTACQAACPTGAIVFGNINDPQSQVARLRAEQRHYGLLTDLNTRPRTTYLARLRNPNPELTES